MSLLGLRDLVGRGRRTYGARQTSQGAALPSVSPKGGDPRPFGAYDRAGDIAYEATRKSDASKALLGLSRHYLRQFEDGGYRELENQAFDAARPKTLDEILATARMGDADAKALNAGALDSALRDASGRAGTTVDPSSGMRRATALSTAATQAQNRNLGLRGELARQRAAQEVAADYHQSAIDRPLLSTYETLAGAQYADERAAAARKAAKKGSKLSAIGSAVGVAAAVFSSRELKDPVGEVKVLDTLAALPVEKWKYKGEDEVHIGTYAEDFNSAFGLGDKPYIHVVDMMGVLLAAVKELNEKVDKLRELE